MTYAFNNVKVTFGGEIFGGEDIWTNSLHLGQEDGDFGSGLGGEPSAGWEGTIASAIERWFKSDSAFISNAATLHWVKIAKLDRDGKYTGDPYIKDFSSPVPGGLQGANVAPQLSVALSMKTDVRRGPGRDGRIYPPLTGYVGANGRDQAAGQRANAFSLLIGEINSAVWNSVNGEAQGVIVASKVGTGVNAFVRSVRVGDVIDTQRTRRNNMKESYVSKDVTFVPSLTL